MRAATAAVLLAATLALPAAPQAQRPTSDFEIATAEKGLAEASTVHDRVAAHLNLGDLRMSRMEIALGRGHYRAAEGAARTAASEARLRSDLETYALATAYRGVAFAKLGMIEESFTAFEESLRYETDSAAIWNHYASGMTILGQPAKAVAAARSSVLLAEEKSAKEPGVPVLLDLAIYRYALAGALVMSDPASREAAAILASITELLDSERLAPVRRQIARDEGFEVFSFVRGDSGAYLSLYNRSLLRLGSIREASGDPAGARDAYERVLERRSDDPAALAALARLSRGDAERERLFAESFAANPWSADTILEYEAWAGGGSPEPDARSAAPVQRALWLIARGRAGEARPLVAALVAENPDNATIAYLEARLALAAGDLSGAEARALPRPFRSAIENERLEATRKRAAAERSLDLLAGGGPIAADRSVLETLLPLLGERDIDAALRARLDAATFSSIARMDPPASSAEGVTVFNSGSIGGVPFRFSVPTAFRGEFAGEELRIRYRITGADGATLLVEPVGIERP